MPFEGQRLHLRIRDRLAGRVGSFQQDGLDPQPRRRGGVANVPQHRLPCPQRLASPVETDGTEQAVLDGVPLRAARRVVADRDGQPQPVAQLLLQLLLPQAWPTAVAAPAIGQDQQVIGVWVDQVALALPPSRQRIDGKLRGIPR